MKVLLINGSPRGEKSTFTALKAIGEELQSSGIDYEIFNVGNEPVRGCTGCGTCFRTKSGHCVFDDDIVNKVIDKIEESDGLIVGSPVHYSAPSGVITSLMDRVCYSAGAKFAFKPASAVVSCRRGGASSALDQLNKYFTILNMPVVSSSYWNMVHGNTAEECLQDEEGIQTMQNLARNMAWMLKSFACAKENGITPPVPVKTARTNFIR